MSLYVEMSDGTETINIHAANILILRDGFSMASPQDQETMTSDGFTDGDEMTHARSQNVRESFRLFFQGGLTTVRANINSMIRMLKRARRYSRKRVGPKIVLKLKPESGDGFYQTRIFNGRVVLGKEALDMELVNGKMEVVLEVLRQPYWEGARTAIPLTNGNGSANTSGLTIKNNDDATAGNDSYVQIAAADITGDLPTPVELVLKNTDATATNATTIFVGHNVLFDPANFNHVLQGESSTAGGGVTSSTPSDAAYSAGQYRTISWSGTAETLLCYWTLSQSLLDKCLGGVFRILMRSISTMATAQLQLRVKAGSLILLQTDWKTYSAGVDIQELFSIKLPPVHNNVASNAALTLELYTRDTDAGAKSINIDFLHLFPLDSWKKLRSLDTSVDGGLDTNDSVIVDDIEGRVLHFDTSAYTPSYLAEGRPLMVWPNELQRLYFLWLDYLNDAAITRTMTVQAFYRPRRLTI